MRRRDVLCSAVAFAAIALAFGPSVARAQENDAEYGERIERYTTDSRFLNDLVDHLPSSATVPSPLEYFGEIIGAPDILHDTRGIYGYMRALAEASPRVTVRSIGETEEGREMILVAVSDEETIANIDRYKELTRRLADPRTPRGSA